MNTQTLAPLISSSAKKLVELAGSAAAKAAAPAIPITATKSNTYIVNDGNARASAESTAAKNALNAVEKWKASRPKEYKSAYTDSINSILKLLSDREFAYDTSSDPLYKQYRDSYLKNARLAYDDMIGKASSLTGGYSNSFAARAAANEYGNELGKLNDIIPELYKAAYDRYNNDGDLLLDRLSMLEKLDDNDWKKYSSLLSDYLNEGKTLMNNYATLSGKDIDTFLDIAELLMKYNK